MIKEYSFTLQNVKGSIVIEVVLLFRNKSARGKVKNTQNYNSVLR